MRARRQRGAADPGRTPIERWTAAAVLALTLGACGGSDEAPTAAPGAGSNAPDAGAAPAANAGDDQPGSIFDRPDLAARGPGVERPGGGPPDVLLISIDTLRADRLGCYGNERPTSPTIDALAARGARFANAYAPDCGTAQSHATMFTGALPAAHGVYNAPDANMRTINPLFSTIVQEMKGAGYQTIVHNEGGQLQRGMGFERGADHAAFRSKGMRRTLEEFEEVLGYTNGEEPLFAFFHTYEVHAPYLPPRRYEGETFHGRFTTEGGGGVFEERYAQLVRDGLRDTAAAKVFLEPYEGLTREHVAWLSALYDEGVLFMDFLLARLLDRWDQVRGLENTLVILTSDHGDQIGEDNKFGHQVGLSKELTHIPFIVAGPGVDPGVVEGPVGLRVVPATILEHLGLERPAHMELSVAHLLEGSSQRTRSGFAHQQVVRGTTFGIVTDSFHAMGLFRNPPRGLPVLLLTDEGRFERLADDLKQQPEYVEAYELGRLRYLRDRRISDAAPPGTRAMGAGARAELEALGYLDDE